MLAHTLWLSFMVWFANTVTSDGYASICDVGQCTCNRGKVQCDCTGFASKEILLKPMFDYLTTTITVSNCNHVHMVSRAVSGLPTLQQVSFNNIASLTLEELAVTWTTNDSRHSGIVIDISHSAIPEIPSYTFRGSIRDILLTDVNVSRTRPFAFATIDHADRIQFTKVRFSEIAPQTFKRFGTNFLIFTDSYINSFPSRTMVNVEVHKEVRFENVKLDRLESTAIHLQGINNLKLVKSTISYIEHNALLVQMKGDVSITDNLFSYLENKAFIGITVDNRYLRDAGKQDLVFENNLLVHTESAALAFNTTGFEIRLDWIRLNQSCSCERVDYWSNDLVILYSNFNITLSTTQVNTIMYCRDPKSIRVIDYQKNNCEVVQFKALFIKTIIIIGVILVVVTMGTVLYCILKRRGKRYINVPTSSKPSLKLAESNKAHILVVPDGKTYRETELHVIVEHVEPIVSTEYLKQESDMSN